MKKAIAIAMMFTCFIGAGPKPKAPVPETGAASIHLNDDGEIQSGIQIPIPRFTNNHNGTITDNLTGLIWLQRVCFYMNWGEGLLSVRQLAHGQCSLTDYSSPGDWHVANVKELNSLINYGFGIVGPMMSNTVGNGPAVDGDPFLNYCTEYLSSTYVKANNYIITVMFADGRQSLAPLTSPGCLWPVRSR